VLEKFGDSVMKLAFTWFLMRKFPSIQEGQLSRFTDHYLAKSFQAHIATQLGLNQFIRTLIDISRHTSEDALEAMFGGLFFISETLISKLRVTTKSEGKTYFHDIGLSYDNCSRLVNHIFNQITFDTSILKGSDINQVKEIFDKMRWKDTTNLGKEIEHETEIGNGQYIVELKFNEPFYKWVDEQNAILYQQGLPLMKFDRNIKTFGRGIDYSTKEARREAYRDGLQVLSKYGITWEWADSRKIADPGWDAELKTLFDKAEQRAKLEGYTGIEFSKLRKGTAAYYLQLCGIDATKRIHVLATIDGSGELPSTTKVKAIINDDDMRKAVLMAYIQVGINPMAVTYRTIRPHI
jgi:dsRNA-specific ribonuclease